MSTRSVGPRPFRRGGLERQSRKKQTATRPEGYRVRASVSGQLPVGTTSRAATRQQTATAARDGKRSGSCTLTQGLPAGILELELGRGRTNSGGGGGRRGHDSIWNRNTPRPLACTLWTPHPNNGPVWVYRAAKAVLWPACCASARAWPDRRHDWPVELCVEVTEARRSRNSHREQEYTL